MKKFLALMLAVIMIFSAGSVIALAYDKYEVTFSDFPYDIAPYRTDYIGTRMGYDYGVDYWYTITNQDGTTTDIKGLPISVSVSAGDYLEFTVSVADYVEPTSIRMLAYPTVLNNSIYEMYDDVTGEPDARYHIAKSKVGTYAVRPTENITVCISEWHLYNKAFLVDMPQSAYYKTSRVQFIPGMATPEESYTGFEWDNTKVVYANETMYFEVRIPMDDPNHNYHYEDYQVYYVPGVNAAGFNREPIYLKKPASSDGTEEAIDLHVAHYETETEWVDIYAIPNVPIHTQIKVAGTVTYNLGMLKEFFDDFSFENIDNLDLGSLDLGPMMEYLIKLLNLIMKILRGFGLNINLFG